MASSDAKPVPIKNTAYRVTFPIYDADGDLVTGATGLDSEVSKDGGTFADCTNEATEIATSSGIYYLDLTSTEMNADTVAVIVKTSSSGAKTTVFVMYPQESGDVKVDVESIKTQAVTCAAGVTVGAYVGNATAALAVDASGRVDVSKMSGTSLTARDIGASVLLSSGTGTGQISLASGAVTAGTVSDKTGYSLASAPPTAAAIADAVWDEPISGHLTVGSTGATLADTSSDAHLTYADWENGGRLDLLLDAVKAKTDNIPASPASTGDIVSAATIADAVWDEAIAGHASAGSTGEALSAAGSAGDPWSTALPGAYSAGSAGYIIGTNLNATVSSRLASASYTEPLDAAGVRTAVGLASANLDTQLADLPTVSEFEARTIVAANYALEATLTAMKGATFDTSTDSLEALRNRGDSAWTTATGFSTLDAAGVRTAVGLASANLDTQLADIPTVSEFNARTLAAADYATAAALATIDDYLDLEIAAILEDTGTTIPGLISGLSIPTTTQIADAVLSRNVSNVESSAGEHTLCTMVLAGLESSVSGTTWTIKRTDGTTTHATKTVATDANADPITGVS